jgi:hypothetical protein
VTPWLLLALAPAGGIGAALVVAADYLADALS